MSLLKPMLAATALALGGLALNPGAAQAQYYGYGGYGGGYYAPPPPPPPYYYRPAPPPPPYYYRPAPPPPPYWYRPHYQHYRRW